MKDKDKDNISVNKSEVTEEGKKDNFNNENVSIFSEDGISSFTSLDLSSSNINITLEIDKKIDDLIIKNIQKDLLNLKINADMSINTIIIVIASICFLYSFLIFSLKNKIYQGYASILIISLPVLFLSAYNHYQNTYLKYSNVLAKTIVKILGYYLFICMITFVVMIVLLINKIKILLELDHFYFFIPVFAILFIFTGFWLFLYQGYNKIYEKDKFFIVLMNLIILNLVTMLIYLKMNKTFTALNWFNILGILSVLHGFNFLYFALQGLNKKGSHSYSNTTNTNENNNCESYLALIDILLNVSLILFFPILGFYLDNHLKNTREMALFVLTWLCSTFIIVKFYNRNEKIKNFFEWKKMVIV